MHAVIFCLAVGGCLLLLVFISLSADEIIPRHNTLRRGINFSIDKTKIGKKSDDDITKMLIHGFLKKNHAWTKLHA